MSGVAEEKEACAGKHYAKYGDPILCPHEVTHGEFCIFHAPAGAKSHEEMMEKLREVRDTKWIPNNVDEWNFSGFVFAGDVSAEDVTDKKTDKEKPLFEKMRPFFQLQLHRHCNWH